MNITIADAAPDAAAFKDLYDTTGWGPASRPPEFYRDALQGSWATRAAYAGQRLVGHARVISDGRLHAFVTEMIVHPEFQSHGIGKRLLNALVEHCLANGVGDIQLFCARGKEAFYLRHGFVPRPDDAPGMQYAPT